MCVYISFPIARAIGSVRDLADGEVHRAFIIDPAVDQMRRVREAGRLRRKHIHQTFPEDPPQPSLTHRPPVVVAGERDDHRKDVSSDGDDVPDGLVFNVDPMHDLAHDGLDLFLHHALRILDKVARSAREPERASPELLEGRDANRDRVHAFA